MNSDDKILKIISNETKDSIMNMSVVTPSIYASMFSGFASSHDTDIKNEKELSLDIIAMQCSNLTKLQNKTSKGVNKLSNNTDKAIDAIKNNDESVLREVLEETNKLRQEFLKLKEAVYKDELTHVYNRKWLHDNLLDEQSDRLSQDGTLAIIDLNYFKEINDTYGHIIGDKVLIFISNQLQKTQQSIIRYGGDEFIIIFEDGIDLDMATKELNKLRDKIVSKKLKTGKDSFRISFSLGAYEFMKGDILSDVIELADKNMYADKIKIKEKITSI